MMRLALQRMFAVFAVVFLFHVHRSPGDSGVSGFDLLQALAHPEARAAHDAHVPGNHPGQIALQERREALPLGHLRLPEIPEWH